jgi:hypothetical protein
MVAKAPHNRSSDTSRPRGARPFVRALLLITSMGAALEAQGVPRVGELVQARVIRPNEADESWCTAPVTAVEGDTLVLTANWSCPRGTYVTDWRVARGDHGSRLTHTVLGLVGGAVIGGLVGRISAGDGCSIDGCDDGALAVGVITVVGAATGALIGTVAGAALPAGQRWEYGESRRPIRVG